MAYLLTQTDEYIDSLTKLVADHQDDVIKQKNKQRGKRRALAQNASGDGDMLNPDEDIHVKVLNTATGEVLDGVTGSGAPRESELDSWLEAHPGWEAVPREVNEEDDDDDNSNSNMPPVSAPVAAEQKTEQPATTSEGEAAAPVVCQ